MICVSLRWHLSLSLFSVVGEKARPPPHPPLPKRSDLNAEAILIMPGMLVPLSPSSYTTALAPALFTAHQAPSSPSAASTRELAMSIVGPVQGHTHAHMPEYESSAPPPSSLESELPPPYMGHVCAHHAPPAQTHTLTFTRAHAHAHPPAHYSTQLPAHEYEAAHAEALQGAPLRVVVVPNHLLNDPHIRHPLSGLLHAQQLAYHHSPDYQDEDEHGMYHAHDHEEVDECHCAHHHHHVQSHCSHGEQCDEEDEYEAYSDDTHLMSPSAHACACHYPETIGESDDTGSTSGSVHSGSGASSNAKGLFKRFKNKVTSAMAALRLAGSSSRRREDESADYEYADDSDAASTFNGEAYDPYLSEEFFRACCADQTYDEWYGATPPPEPYELTYEEGAALFGAPLYPMADEEGEYVQPCDCDSCKAVRTSRRVRRSRGGRRKYRRSVPRLGRITRFRLSRFGALASASNAASSPSAAASASARVVEEV